MKITAVKTYHLKHKLPQSVGCSTFLYSERDALLVKITTDEGLVGWGETAHMGGLRALIEEQLAPSLIGQDPRQHRKLWRKLWGANYGNALAVAALDTALEDLRGKALGVSVAELYGGRLRDRVAVYASGMNYTDGVEAEKQYPDDAVRLAEMGFKAMKMRIGRYGPQKDIATVEAVRKAVGPNIKVMADGNGAYSLPTAILVGKEFERLGLFWFEEPIPQGLNYAGYEELRSKLTLALAGGEVVESRSGAKQLLCRGCFDIIQPDLSLCGGFRECLAIAEMAQLFGIQCIPHCWAGGVTIAATLQLLSLLPDATWGLSSEVPMLEYDMIENPFRDRLVKQPIQLAKDGFMDVPRGPGFGVDIDEEELKRYAVK